MFGKIVLAVWSAAGLAWWIVARRLVASKPAQPVLDNPGPRRSLSIFKPLPHLGPGDLASFAPGVESFVAQLDSDSEMVLGVHEADRVEVTPFLESLASHYPKARVKVVFRGEPNSVANPKIAWQRHLASQATGELWLWSDADIVAPRDFVENARAEFAQSDATMLTFPYVVRHIPTPSALLEALFVNADFYPGTLLLRQAGPVDFGLGAGMLFTREAFERLADWTELGACLADDFHLGQKLEPVRIGNPVLETVPHHRTWHDAARHDVRWARTIRWNRPGGSFARILILPVLGWVIAAGTHPLDPAAWAGLVAMMQIDVLAAFLICRAVGCRLRGGDLGALEAWSLWRICLWILSWLPIPVAWRGQTWHGPRSTGP